MAPSAYLGSVKALRSYRSLATLLVAGLLLTGFTPAGGLDCAPGDVAEAPAVPAETAVPPCHEMAAPDASLPDEDNDGPELHACCAPFAATAPAASPLVLTAVVAASIADRVVLAPRATPRVVEVDVPPPQRRPLALSVLLI